MFAPLKDILSRALPFVTFANNLASKKVVKGICYCNRLYCVPYYPVLTRNLSHSFKYPDTDSSSIISHWGICVRMDIIKDLPLHIDHRAALKSPIFGNMFWDYEILKESNQI